LSPGGQVNCRWTIFIIDRQHHITYANPAALSLSGYHSDELIDQPLAILKCRTDDHEPSNLWQAMDAATDWQGRMNWQCKEGNTYPSLTSITPLFEDERLSGFVISQQDLTAYDKLESEFHQAQKMEALGTLVSGIAHDFNNSLAGITGSLFLLRFDVAELPEAIERIDSIERLAFSAAGMIRQLLTFSRSDMTSMNPLSLAPFMKESVRLYRAAVPENISLRLEVDHVDATIRGDINLLQQAILNLIGNARDALLESDRPEIRMKLERFQADQHFLEQHPQFNVGTLACISISDNGNGIASEHLDHIFEPFYTTKAVGKGTGLGLAMLYGSIKTHGGIVEVESRPAEGTTFKIFLPLLDDETTVVEQQKELIETGHGELILLVDDDEQVRATGVEILLELGYQVVTASNGREALEKFSAEQQIHLVLMDIVMPESDGIETANIMRGINPQIKVIFVTGYDPTHSVRKIHHFNHDLLLSKPFPVAKLSHLMRRLLEEENQ